MTNHSPSSKNDPNQPLTAKAYAIVALIGLFIGIGLLFFYVYQVPKLVQNGSQDRIFYLLLIPWALSCAAFLFGAMRSYARFSHRHFGNFLELGGPVVLFCLVLGGGFKLVPPPSQDFDLTVQAHSADGKEAIIKSGSVTIDFENDRQTRSFDPSTGQAEFKGRKAKFIGTTLNILPQVEGFEEKWIEQKLQGNVLDLALVRKPAHLTGSIVPAPTHWKDLRVVSDGAPLEAKVDELGRFDLSTNGYVGDRIKLKIYAADKLVYDDYQILPGPVTLHLHPSH
jgi:hypothetical protein